MAIYSENWVEVPSKLEEAIKFFNMTQYCAKIYLIQSLILLLISLFQIFIMQASDNATAHFICFACVDGKLSNIIDSLFQSNLFLFIFPSALGLHFIWD